MYDKYSRPGQSYGSALLILIGAVGVGLFIGSLAAGAVWSAMTNRPITNMPAELLDPRYTSANVGRVVQLVQTLFAFFIPTWIVAGMLNRKPFRLIGFNDYFSVKQVGLVILIMLASMPLVGALAELNQVIPLPKAWELKFRQWEENFSDSVKALSKITGPGDYILSLFIMAIVPAVFEEVLFRGGLQNLLTRATRKPILAIVITSILFSAIHVSYYGFIPRVALGIVLGLLYFYSESIWLPIIAHAFNNGFIVTQIYILTMKGKPIESSMNETLPMWYGLIAIAVLVFLFRIFRKTAATDLAEKKPKEDVALEEQWLT